MRCGNGNGPFLVRCGADPNQTLKKNAFKSNGSTLTKWHGSCCARGMVNGDKLGSLLSLASIRASFTKSDDLVEYRLDI